jgi:hypothetical protein
MTIDIDDAELYELEGDFPPSVFLSPQKKLFGVRDFLPDQGCVGLIEIEPGNEDAMFVVDWATRQHGFIMIKKGIYAALLVSVSEPLPEIPADQPRKDYKIASAYDAWSPRFGDVRIEARGMHRTAIRSAMNAAVNSPEARQGLVPVMMYAEWFQKDFPQHGASYWGLHVVRKGWLPRAKIASFAAREIVSPLPSLQGQERLTLTKLIEHEKKENPIVDAKGGPVIEGTATTINGSTRRTLEGEDDKAGRARAKEVKSKLTQMERPKS